MTAIGSERPSRGLRPLDALSAVVLLATCITTAIAYPRLPARVPIHYDVFGRVDGTAGRALGAWLLPAATLVVAVIVRGAQHVLPRDWRERMRDSPTAGLTFVLTGFLCALQLVLLHVALEHETNAGALLTTVIGFGGFALGQLMPRTRRNPLVGVRTAWTLSSDENWASTHRIAGIAFSAAGAVAVIAALAGVPAIGVAAVLSSAVVPLVWSFVHARRHASR